MLSFNSTAVVSLHVAILGYTSTMFCFSDSPDLFLAEIKMSGPQPTGIATCTVEPPNKGYVGDNIILLYKFTSFVLCGEVVLFSEVVSVLKL